ncbi:hypothetical protein ACQ4LE_007129 [Meloidogyne hapla]
MFSSMLSPILFVLLMSMSKTISTTTNDYVFTTEVSIVNETDFINDFDFFDPMTLLEFTTTKNVTEEPEEDLILNDIPNNNENEVNKTIDPKNTTENTTEFFEENTFDNEVDSTIVPENETENTKDVFNDSISGNNSDTDFTTFTPEIKKCVPRSICYKDEDCGIIEKSGKANLRPRCLGIFLGTCDCTACISGLHCMNQTSCGGLYNSCENSTGICKCIEAHKLNGFANYGEALLKFCNKQKCNGELDTCFGLPCRRGRCFCH